MINKCDISHSRWEISREGWENWIDLETVVDDFALFSGFELNKNLDAIQHRVVFALFSSFEFNANLDAIQHTGVFALFSHFPVLASVDTLRFY
jgi:hypothetical protein